jgi:hypothetical protein
MDYGRPMKPFFIEIQNFWAWAEKFWDIWDIFGRTKGQLISELLFDVLNFPKHQCQNLMNFCPRT